MKWIILLSFFGVAHAALINSVYLHGVVTNNFQNELYISVRDTFDQEYVLPKKLIEKKTGRKVAGKSNREFKGAIYFFEISTKEYALLGIECQKELKGTNPASAKKCPPSL